MASSISDSSISASSSKLSFSIEKLVSVFTVSAEESNVISISNGFSSIISSSFSLSTSNPPSIKSSREISSEFDVVGIADGEFGAPGSYPLLPAATDSSENPPSIKSSSEISSSSLLVSSVTGVSSKERESSKIGVSSKERESSEIGASSKESESSKFKESSKERESSEIVVSSKERESSETGVSSEGGASVTGVSSNDKDSSKLKESSISVFDRSDSVSIKSAPFVIFISSSEFSVVSSL